MEQSEFAVIYCLLQTVNSSFPLVNSSNFAVVYTHNKIKEFNKYEIYASYTGLIHLFVDFFHYLQ